MIKNTSANAGNAKDAGSIHGSGSSPGEGSAIYNLQYSCLENPMDRGACQATVHGVTKSWTRLSKHTCIYTHTSFRPGPDGGAHLKGLVSSEKERVESFLFVSTSMRKEEVI